MRTTMRLLTRPLLRDVSDIPRWRGDLLHNIFC